MEQPGFSPATYVNDLGPLYQSIWRNLPFPGAMRKGELTHLDPIKNIDKQFVYELGVPMWFRMKLHNIWLPNEPLITVTGAKTIVKTQVAGADFTTKEIIGLDDYKVNIKGIAVREGQRFTGTDASFPPDYPKQFLQGLLQLYRRNEALEVECALLTVFGIERLVIEDINLPGIPGSQGYIAYEINAVSDESALAKLLRP